MDSVTLADEYESVEDIAEQVIEGVAEVVGMSPGEIEEIPVTAIDEVEMPRAVANDGELSQEEWDMLRRRIRFAVEDQGYQVD